jgi:hypothetical protein
MIDVTVDGLKNLIKTISVNGKATPLEQEFLYYTGHAGLSILDRSSGAYIFRPNGNEPSPLLYSPIITSVINGKWKKNRIRLF